MQHACEYMHTCDTYVRACSGDMRGETVGTTHSRSGFQVGASLRRSWNIAQVAYGPVLGHTCILCSTHTVHNNDIAHESVAFRHTAYGRGTWHCLGLPRHSGQLLRHDSAVDSGPTDGPASKSNRGDLLPVRTSHRHTTQLTTGSRRT